MKPSDIQMSIQCQFDSLLKKVVKGVVMNYRKELKRRNDKEVLFCELPQVVVNKLAFLDEYNYDYTIFSICNVDVRVLDDKLAEALKKLSQRNRENVLMYYFLEMSDTEIAEIQNISRSGVYQNRHNALNKIKEILKEEQKDEA